MAVYDVSGTPKEVRSNRKHTECSPGGLHFISFIIAFNAETTA